MTDAALDVEAMRQLVTDVRRGDRPAAERLVREHDAWMRSVIYGVTGRPDLVDDIVQQAWTQVWERLGSLADPTRLRSWLYAIVRNAAIDYGVAHKRRSRLVVADDEAGELAPDPASVNPARAAADAEMRCRLLRAVEGLPALYREPFVLRHLEDWTYAEIGALLGLPVETVETRLVRARRLLRETLNAETEC
jgi:RNA polymerase sigma-70 factor (ECF subfamily)